MTPSEKSLIDANPEPLRMDLEFYDDIRARVSERKLLQRSIIPPNNGRGFRVDKGQTFKIIQEQGPQVVDVCLWNADCPQRESLSLNRTLLCRWIIHHDQFQALVRPPHVSTHCHLYRGHSGNRPGRRGMARAFLGESLRFRGLGADVRRARFKRMSPQPFAGRGIYGPYRGRRNR